MPLMLRKPAGLSRSTHGRWGWLGHKCMGLGLIGCLALARMTGEAAAETYEEILARQPGVEIILRRNSDGSETKEFHLPSKVWFEVRERPSGPEVVGTDESGNEPIMCMLYALTVVKVVWDLYLPSDETEMRSALSDAIDRVHSFIVTNSVIPITKVELEERLNRQLPDKSRWGSNRKSGDTALTPTAIAKTIAEIKNGVDEVLAVPRPPAELPCQHSAL